MLTKEEMMIIRGGVHVHSSCGFGPEKLEAVFEQALFAASLVEFINILGDKRYMDTDGNFATGFHTAVEIIKAHIKENQ